MFNRKTLVLIACLAVILAVTSTSSVSFAAKPTTAPACKQCHPPAGDVVRGTLVAVSEKFKTLQVATGSIVWVIKYDDDTKLTGAAKLTEIPKDKEIGVRFKGDDKTPHAVNVSVKPPAKVAPEKLMPLDEMAKLVSAGPEKGNYVLIDSRPAPRFNEGHLPFAVNMPLDKFDAMKEQTLPKDKDKLVIFYCAGPT